MMGIADFLNHYANLLLVVVTIAYVMLTWRMVQEMRAAREAEHQPILCAAIVPLAPLYAKLQIENAGLGPALDIEAVISVVPDQPELRKKWKYSALGVGGKQTFLIPSRDLADQPVTLADLAKRHEGVAIEITWKDSTKKKYSASSQFVLSAVADGWYQAGALREPEEFLVQFGRLTKNVDSIGKEIKDVKNEMRQIRYNLTPSVASDNSES